MNRQDYIIAKLTDTQVEVRPSVSVQKALKDSMAELAKEVRLAVSYGELSESLQQRIELVMRFFLVLGEGVDDSVSEPLQQAASLEEPAATVMDAESSTASFFGMGRRQRLKPQLGDQFLHGESPLELLGYESRPGGLVVLDLAAVFVEAKP